MARHAMRWQRPVSHSVRRATSYRLLVVGVGRYVVAGDSRVTRQTEVYK
jgi:hypothetical protein